ncbi:hypothetical protein ACIRP7_16800 [Streptomyces sp. NPDC102270]|uniref:hypothetical protein n=1 Tax=Streptomyces sp. NPDC102270 TaxID=3366150 RepID=UPI00382BD484
MSWTRGLLALLAVCVLLVTGSVSCGTHGAQERKDGRSVAPVGKVLDDTDHEGRHYREVDKENAPDVGIEVQPATDDCWTVRLTVQNFTFSPAATKAKAVSGRGVAVLFVDDRPVTTLRTPSYRLPSAYVPQGTHKVTARLYADDGTVWAVDGTPVESTADVTASKPESTGSGGSGARSMEGGASELRPTGSAGDTLEAQPIARVGGGGVSYQRVVVGGGVAGSRGVLGAGGGVAGSGGVVGAGCGVAGSRVGMGAGGRASEPPLTTRIRAASDVPAAAGTAAGAPDAQAVAGTGGGLLALRVGATSLAVSSGAGVVLDGRAVAGIGLPGSRVGARTVAAGSSLAVSSGAGVVLDVQAVAGASLPGAWVGIRTAAAGPSLMTSPSTGVAADVQPLAGKGLSGAWVGIRTVAAGSSLTASSGAGVAADVQAVAGKGLSGSQVGARTAAVEPSLTAGIGVGARPGGGR